MIKQQNEFDLYTLRQLIYALGSDSCDVLSVAVSRQFFQSKTFSQHENLFLKLKQKLKVLENIESQRDKKDRGQVRARVRLNTYNSSKSWLKSSQPKQTYRILLLDQVQDPQNFGAMIRTAKFFSYDAVLSSKRNSAPLSATVAQSSSGALFSLPIIWVNNVKREIDFLKQQYFFCLGLDIKAKKTLSESHFLNENLLIVMGNEGDGMRSLTRSACDEVYKISNNPGFESLNVSAAAAIAMYQFDLGKK